MKAIEKHFKDRLMDLSDHVCLNEVRNVFNMNGMTREADYIHEVEKSLRGYVATACANATDAR